MFYQKGIDITNDKSMFNFLKNHFKYDTLNSWNGLKSIANNVKVYNLNLDGDYWTALKYLEQDEYFVVNEMLADWERDHRGYKLGFNGRSGGYIVMYNSDNNHSILPDSITYSDNYDEYKAYCKDYYGSVKDARSELKFYTQLVQSFDKLCDELRDFTNVLSKSDFALDTACLIADDFNYDYENDLNELGIKPLCAESDGSINIAGIINHRALYEAFTRVVRAHAEDSYKYKDGVVYIEG